MLFCYVGYNMFFPKAVHYWILKDQMDFHV